MSRPRTCGRTRAFVVRWRLRDGRTGRTGVLRAERAEDLLPAESGTVLYTVAARR